MRPCSRSAPLDRSTGFGATRAAVLAGGAEAAVRAGGVRSGVQQAQEPGDLCVGGCG